MSPRAFDSDEVARNPGHLILRFTENVECEAGCGTVFEGVFFDTTGSMTIEDMTDPPVGEHICPFCGRHWVSELTGWTFFSEAG